MIIEKLQELLLEEGWYLHKCESVCIGGTWIFRGMVRFPCRAPIHFGYILGDFLTSEKVFNKIKGSVYH